MNPGYGQDASSRWLPLNAGSRRRKPIVRLNPINLLRACRLLIGGMGFDEWITVSALYLGENPKQDKKDQETDEADADEGQIAHRVTSCRLLGL